MTTRLIDIMLSAGDTYADTLGNFMLRDMKNSTPIVIDNVSDYYWKIEDRILLHSDYPNIAPPFEDMFFEWRSPNEVKHNGAVTKMEDNDLPDIYGARVLSYKTPENMKSGLWETSEWFMSICVIGYSKRDGEIRSPDFYALVSARSDGSPNENCMMILLDQRGEPYVPSKESVRRESASRELGEFISTISPVFMALSFMHCKNVEMIKSPALPLTRKRRNKPRARYYTLKIEPMRKVMKSDGNLDSKGLKHALHVCRGHFKDYRETGLFGKNKGLYWWESHIRGSSSSGVVVKDYKVDAPKGSE